MILTCPSCATRYFADEASLGESVRHVRCAACGHAWRPVRDGWLAWLRKLLASATRGARPGGSASPSVRPLTPGAPDLRRSLVRWGTVAAATAAAMTLAVVFRVEVVQAWPTAAAAYAAAGFEVTAEGLVLESPSATPSYSVGERTLTVTAVIRNTSGRLRTIPPVRIALLDETGEEAFSWTVAPDLTELAPGQAARFTAVLAHPPADAEDLELRFARGPAEGAVPAAAEVL